MSGSQLAVKLLHKAILFGLITEAFLILCFFSPVPGMCGFVYNSEGWHRLRAALSEHFFLKLTLLLSIVAIWCIVIWFGLLKLVQRRRGATTR